VKKLYNNHHHELLHVRKCQPHSECSRRHLVGSVFLLEPIRHRLRVSGTDHGDLEIWKSQITDTASSNAYIASHVEMAFLFRDARNNLVLIHHLKHGTK
jgi:hypothetical protein